MDDVVHSAAFSVARMGAPVGYPPISGAPYGPDRVFPELAGLEVKGGVGNAIFPLVREALRGMGLDAAHYGTARWNPLLDLVKPGGRVVVKPNWVLHYNMGVGGMECMVTHPSVLRAVLEYVFLTRPAEVVLGDAPLQGCDFGKLLDFGGMREVIGYFQGLGLPLRVRDFRRTVTTEDEDGIKRVREGVRSESKYVRVDLGRESFLEPISGDWKRFRVTVYDPRKMWAHHRPGVHEFLLAREVFEADLVVNCPKLKAHKKAGLTCCLKNLIGVNGNKEYLPHHRKGARDGGKGGDSHAERSWLVEGLETALDVINRHRDWPRVYDFCERVIYHIEGWHRRRAPDTQMEGNWHGNDTIWRTCLDLNRAVLYADTSGEMRERPQRQVISIVDAIITGQDEGPLAPNPLETGAIFAAHNPAVGDWLGARLMRFDPERIALTAHAVGGGRWGVCGIRPKFPGIDFGNFPAARPAGGWVGAIEEGGEEGEA